LGRNTITLNFKAIESGNISTSFEEKRSSRSINHKNSNASLFFKAAGRSRILPYVTSNLAEMKGNKMMAATRVSLGTHSIAKYRCIKSYHGTNKDPCNAFRYCIKENFIDLSSQT
jgi:hypothetical protein